MTNFCRDTNKCWAYPGQDISPNPGCGERCGGEMWLIAVIREQYRQTVNDWHDSNPRIKRMKQFIDGNG